MKHELNVKNKGIIGLVVAVSIFMTFTFLRVEAINMTSAMEVIDDPKQSNPEQAHWSIAALSDSLASLQKGELVFMDANSMVGTYIEVGRGQSFHRNATKDDLYYLHRGDCSTKVSKQKKMFSSGDIIYVKEGSEFTIVDVKEPLQIVIVSMKLSSNNSKPKWKHFSESTIESGRDADLNSWNPFLVYSNVILGHYMLPYEIDGDGRLVHEWWILWFELCQSFRQIVPVTPF